ncbi:MAG: transcription termination factor Rho [Victivallales bacterium]|nr:transcription termination factor Rho [Victivallales bacterium]
MSSKTEKNDAPQDEAVQDSLVTENPVDDKNAIPMPDLRSSSEDDVSSEPLFSSLLPNLGTGLVSLSKPRSGIAQPVTLPPPKAQLEKERLAAAKAATKPPASSGGEVPPPPAGRGGKGGVRGAKGGEKPGKGGRKNVNVHYVRDEQAVTDDLFSGFEDEGELEAAYVETEEVRDLTRPRLNRLHLLAVDLAVLAKIAGELSVDVNQVDDGDLEGLVAQIIAANDQRNNLTELSFASGVIEFGNDGYGYLRCPELNYLASPDDTYVTPLYIKRYGLRPGDLVLGCVKRPREKETMSAMLKVYAVNGVAPADRHGLRAFETLTPYYPTQRILLERGKDEIEMRVVDLITPLGRGQRGLIVAPPRTGKTIILQKIANSVLANNDDITLIILLIDERPEEVTDMRRLVDAEIVASTFDQPPEHHVALAELVTERAKRLVENGKHVVILLDSLTRLARAYNTLAPRSGRILSGGLDANALHKPKRFFGAARNIQGGGSLTVLATALIDTGSRMDELIFEEFKGTGNMELNLDRLLADRRVFPAIDITRSGTRREELIVNPEELEYMWYLRRGLATLNDPVNAMERLVVNLRKYGTNAEFLLSLKASRDKAKIAEQAENH